MAIRTTPEYRAWLNIKERCLNTSSRDYHRWGARGITVCDKWRNNFAAFLTDVGYRPSPEHSIDRINNNGNYEPGNVKWSTAKEQANNRRDTQIIEIDGRRTTLGILAMEHNLPYKTLWRRLSEFNWDINKALNTPVRGYQIRG